MACKTTIVLPVEIKTFFRTFAADHAVRVDRQGHDHGGGVGGRGRCTLMLLLAVKMATMMA